jgi:hypothetical protein
VSRWERNESPPWLELVSAAERGDRIIALTLHDLQLREQFFNNGAVDIGQPEVATLVAVR